MDEMKSTDVSVNIFSKTDRHAEAIFELGEGKRMEFHLRYNGKTAWADAFMFEGATMSKGIIWQFPFSESAQPLHTLVEETRYLAERALRPQCLMDFVRIAMSKARVPAFFRGQVEAELKLMEACVHHGPEVAELHRGLEDCSSFGRTFEMDDATLSEEFAKAKSSLDLWSGSVGRRDDLSDGLAVYEMEQTVTAARRMLMLHRETVRRKSMSAHEKMAFRFEQKQLAQH
ncbi:hypothetical protein K3X44_05880 [Aliiroseovarius crassostreae]|uniref:hypothetical protein n=1 Tax=Aliiroseovarius crassostreae TaxID=154981 RepID=UPI002209F2B5|nr:hypothetical protein [Aliiroseovarius crassostreae]UWQ02849.1 hypothetical protein K3X44_05880 [Aliiroseovarius crassostreae]